MSAFATKAHNHDQHITDLEVIGRRQDSILDEGGMRFWNSDEGVSLKKAQNDTEASAQGVFVGGIYYDDCGKVHIRTDANQDCDDCCDCCKTINLNDGDDIRATIEALDVCKDCNVTINLAAGDYAFPTPVDKALSRLCINGDTRPIVGCSFVHGSQMDGLSAVFNAPQPPENGRGRDVNIQIAGNQVIVTYSNTSTFTGLNIPPSFDDLVPGDILTWVDANGNLSNHTILTAQANNFTMTDAPPALVKGVGFVVNPNVRINNASPTEINFFEGMKCLKWIGCTFDNNFSFHVSCDVSIFERNLFSGPGNFVHLGRHCLNRVWNTHFATAWNGAGSHAYWFLQGFLGTAAHFFTETNMVSLNIFSVFAACNKTVAQAGIECGAFVTNGGSCCFFFSDFLNCETVGLRITAGSFGNLQHAKFCNNGTGCLLDYNSTASSVAIPIFTYAQLSPFFIDNTVGLSANNSSVALIIGADANLSGNVDDFVTDGNNAVPNDTYGARFSIINHA
jgi:hypothetical protein